jgi:hypothetical protein
MYSHCCCKYPCWSIHGGHCYITHHQSTKIQGTFDNGLKWISAYTKVARWQKSYRQIFHLDSLLLYLLFFFFSSTVFPVNDDFLLFYILLSQLFAQQSQFGDLDLFSNIRRNRKGTFLANLKYQLFLVTHTRVESFELCFFVSACI